MSEQPLKDLRKLCVMNLIEQEIDIIIKMCKAIPGFIDFNRSVNGNKFLIFPYFKAQSEAANAREAIIAKGYKVDYANTKRPEPQPISPPDDFNGNDPYGICIRCGKNAYYNCQRCDDFYCSVDCQKIDWPIHKLNCFPMPELIPSKIHKNLLIAKTMRNVKLNGSTAATSGSSNDRSVEANNQNVTPRRNSLLNGVATAAAQSSSTPPPSTTATINLPISQSIPNDSEVLITYVRSHKTVYIRSVATHGAYTKLMQDVAEAALIAPHLESFPCPKKDMVLAPFEDIYYRGMVLACNSLAGLVRIAFVDFGNTEEIPFNKLKVLPNELWQRPRLILIVNLKNVKDDKQAEAMKKYLENLSELNEAAEILKVHGDGTCIDKNDTVELLDLKSNQSISEKLNCLLNDMD